MKRVLFWLVILVYLLIGMGASWRAVIQHPEKNFSPAVVVLWIAWPIAIGVILMDLQYKSQEKVPNVSESFPSRAA